MNIVIKLNYIDFRRAGAASLTTLAFSSVNLIIIILSSSLTDFTEHFVFERLNQ